MNHAATLLVTLTFCSTLAAQDRPIPAKEAPKRMTVPEGFNVTLFAGEPDVVQPIAITFDDRGRLWVVECLSYPRWTKDGSGQDRVTCYEDTDGDGQYDVKHVVFDKGSNLSGIELGHGGIWLCSIPNLLFVPCAFNADKPTVGKPEVVLDGWSLNPKHNVFNSLAWGPDGWLYGCNGIIDTSHVGRPGTPANQRTPMNCGVWRYHPKRKTFEVVANGTTNPFGLDFDERGEIFITNCVIHHLWHVVPGARFERMYGQDLNPNVYSLMQSCADHIHWGGGDWTSSRGGKGVHSEAGGGHAHVGCMVYLGDNWPERYRNGVFTCNLHGNRVNHDRLERTGSGYVAKHEKDVLLANDPWFRGIAIKFGPDGGVYVTDWCDTGECHNYDKVDPTNGRIYKVTYGKIKGFKGDLSKLKDSELVDLHKHKNQWLVRHARRILQERHESGMLERETALFFKVLRYETNQDLEIVWTAHLLNSLKEKEYLALLESSSEAIRTWAMRLGLDQEKPVASWPQRLVELAKSEKSPYVRMHLASELQHLPLADRRRLAANLLQHSEDAADPMIPLLIWYGLEPALTADPKATLPLIETSKMPIIREYIARRAIGINPDYLEPLVAMAAKTSDAAIQQDILKGIQEAFGGWRQMAAPKGWEEHSKTLLQSPVKQVRERATLLGVMFGNQALIDQLRQTLGNQKAQLDDRELALKSLVQRGKDDILPLLKGLLAEPALRTSAIRALAAFKDQDTPALLLKLYPSYSAADKEDVVQTLASRPAWAMILLDGIEKGQLARSDVSVFVARQMQGLKDKQVADKLAKVWGQVKPASADRVALTKKYKEILSPQSLKSADLSRGRFMYAKTCAACHRMYDDGGNIGPALTGSQRHNLDYLLENVIDPSAVVPKEFQMTKIETQNGRFINGIIKQETDKTVAIQTQNELIVLPKSDIAGREQSKFSLMPDGLLDKLKEDEVRDLIAYLQSKDQVPLPK
jgi:putative membrane-bound dehydrogenase-like protein